MKKSKLTNILFIFVVIVLMQIKANVLIAISSEAEGIESFPNSYKPYLIALNKLYPNWKFTALNTNLDWDDVIYNESGPKLKNAVPLSYSEYWRHIPINYTEGIDGRWVSASTNAVKYSMDPRNYLNVADIFQFEKMNYKPSYQIKSGVENILNGTEMYNKNVSYTDINNNVVNTNVKYSDLIMNAGNISGVSPYYLAARIKQETRGDIYNNSSISGKVNGYIGLYNFFNIGATGGVKNGLDYAKSRNWNSPEISINEGAKSIYNNYLKYGQNTIYLQKYDVNLTENSTAIYTFQYMTNIFAPKSESISLYNVYNSSSNNLMNMPFEFLIPVYKNMPDIPFGYDQVVGFNAVNEVVRVNTNQNTNLNIRSGPFNSETIIATAKNNDVITRISVSNDSSIKYDKVKLSNGIIGYASRDYLVVDVSSIEFNKNDIKFDNINLTDKINATINPYNATNKNIVWYSSNKSVATVTQDGTVKSIGNGTAIITAKTPDGKVEAKCNVKVSVKPQNISLDKNEYNIIMGNYINLNPSINPSNAEDKEYSIIVEDPSIVTAESNKINALKIGSTYITYKLNNFDISIKVKINVIEFDNITNYQYNIINNNFYIKKYIGPQYVNNIVVPEKINGYNVVSIGENAFANCTGFTGTLTIPSSLTNIGKNAFLNCNNITGSIKINNIKATIGDSAFNGCNKLSVKVMYPTDIKGHWGQDIIAKWIDRGITAGDSRVNQYYPDQYILKSDIMYTINRLMKYTVKQDDISIIKDVSNSDWYYVDTQRAIRAGYLYPMTMNNVYPNNKVNREEFMVMINRALKLPTASLSVLDKYTDKSLISSNIKQEVANYIKAFGFSGNMVNGKLCLIPQNPLTKADTFYFIDKAFNTYDNPPVVNNVPNDAINHWSKDILEALIDRKITSSHNITKCFYPDDYILKADVIYTLNRMTKFTELAGQTEASKYSDLNKNEWYYTDMLKAIKAGYIYPLNNNKINPNSRVNREEFMVMINRALKLPNANLNVLDKYSDKALISNNIKQEVANYIKAFGFGGNVVNGKVCLIPQNPLTKADTMFFIYRALPMENIEILNSQKNLNYGDTLNFQVTINQTTLTGNENPKLSLKIGNGSEIQIEPTKIVGNKLNYTYKISNNDSAYISYKLIGGNLKGTGNVYVTYSQYYKCDLYKVI